MSESHPSLARWLRELRGNEVTTFGLFDRHRRMTVDDARQLSDALKENESVVEFRMNLEYYPIPAIPWFMDCIESNFRKVEEIIVDCNPPRVRNEVDNYQYQVGEVFSAIRRNPSIKKLTASALGNRPQTVVDLLSTSVSTSNGSTTASTGLTCFDLLQEHCRSPFTPEMSQAVAEGLAQSTHIKEFIIRIPGPVEEMSIDMLRTLLPGFGRASSVESLTFSLMQITSESLSTLSNMLLNSPCLKILVINPLIDPFDDGGIEELVSALLVGHAECSTGLEKLVLREVNLQSPPSTMEEDPHNIAPVQVPQQVNRSLQILELHRVYITTCESVRLLHSFVGLRELSVTRLETKIDEEEHNDEEMMRRHAECWAELIRGNPNLVTVSVQNDIPETCAEGIVRGARGHKSLEILELDCSTEYREVNPTVSTVSIGTELCQLLGETSTTLRKLSLTLFFVSADFADGLAKGICTNKSLSRFVLRRCHFDGLGVYNIILEAFLVNQTVKYFDFVDCTIYSELDHESEVTVTLACCQSLSNVFRVNNSLCSFCLPHMSLNADNMSALIDDGLAHNDAIIKSIDFSSCVLEHGALNRLLRNLPRMRSIEKVAIQGSLDAEGKALLLEAVKVKKNLRYFKRDAGDPQVSDPVNVEIDFYLKLNRFGRRIFDCGIVRPATVIWPILLSRMASEPSDADALFFFIDHYFQRHHKPIRAPTEQQPLEQAPPPCKRSRLE